MRERNIGLVWMLSIGFFLVMLTASTVQQPVQTTAPSAPQQSVLTYTPSAGVPMVMISRSSKPIPLNMRGPDWSIAIATPPPLPQVQRSAIINDVRRAVGISGNVVPNPPAKVILTPDVPRVGPNWLTYIYIHNYPGGGGFEAITAKHSTINTMGGDHATSPTIIFHFGQLIPGKTYMLDITVGSSYNPRPEWDLYGEVQGRVVPQNGHILAGFTALGTVCEIGLSKYVTNVTHSGYFFGCELTPIN